LLSAIFPGNNWALCVGRTGLLLYSVAVSLQGVRISPLSDWTTTVEQDQPVARMAVSDLNSTRAK
jgi:hypothetical protein